jgi:hypothetical protein
MLYEKEVLENTPERCLKHIAGRSIGDLLDGKDLTLLVCLRRRGHRGPHAARHAYKKRIWCEDNPYDIEFNAVITFKQHVLRHAGGSNVA